MQVEGVGVGHHYKFVIRSDPGELWRNDPYARQVDAATDVSVVVDPEFDWSGDEAFRTPAWDELVIYEMHIGTFASTSGGATGDLRTAAARLSHLVELGINAVQLMPISEFPGRSSFGYNPTHLFAVEAEYGGPTALKSFIKAAHAHGIAVLIDVVDNHLDPSDLDLWRFDSWQENEKGGIYFYNDWRASTLFGDTRPDYGRPEVRQFLCDHALFWLDEFRADGLRFDMTLYIRTVHGDPHDPGQGLPEGWSLMAWINREVQARFPSKLTIAEDLQDGLRSPVLPTRAVPGSGASGRPTSSVPCGPRWSHPTIGDRSMGPIREAILGRFDADALERVIYTESRDEVSSGQARLPHEIWPDQPGGWFSRKRSTLGAVLIFTAPGIPMVFQGQELLEDEWFRDDDPLDWLKKDRFAGIFRLYQDLIRLRRSLFDHTQGLRGQGANVFHVNEEDKVIAFRWDRGGPGDDVVVLLNFANRSHDWYWIGLPRAGVWHVRFNSELKTYSEDFGSPASGDVPGDPQPADGLPASGGVALRPYSALILSQDPDEQVVEAA